MNAILRNSLYHLDKARFALIRRASEEFNAAYNGNNIVRVNVFNIIKDYGRHSGQKIEIIRIPIKDEEFCACTCVRKGRIIIISNSILPMSKQIFAAAHELYHIIKYINGEDEDFPLHGSILKSEVLDDADVKSEDRDANAFAGLFLAQSRALREQFDIYNISTAALHIRDIIKLMDRFAIPYKAVVLRLYEENLIDEKKTDEFLNMNAAAIENEISLAGIAVHWQKKDNSIIELGSLNENLSVNEKLGFITEERAESDKKRIHDLIADIQK